MFANLLPKFPQKSFDKGGGHRKASASISLFCFNLSIKTSDKKKTFPMHPVTSHSLRSLIIENVTPLQSEVVKWKKNLGNIIREKLNCTTNWAEPNYF